MLNIETFYYLCGMERKIRTYGGYFQAFIKTLDDKVLRKIDYILQLLKIRERLSTKFIKAIKDGLFELRIEYEGNIYRVFFIFDEGQVVVLFNGFQKKTQKTPKSEIDKALKIMEAYYADKQSQNIKL
ncbi:putative addiction module killer protein [Prevotella sp. oral taxon 306 str. F0472]|nr:putative addiction module killer protein [Prevotella sp. oral taxon 306 str. F0472]